MLNKATPPKLHRVLPRQRLFDLLDKAGQTPALWLAGPAGSGKTTLMASYLSAKELPAIWYQIDVGDGDLPTFFYYLGQAAKPLIDPQDPPLPLLTPEYLLGVETFAMRYFENLCQRLSPPTWIVLDNFQEIPEDSPLIPILAKAIEQVPAEFTLVLISRHDPPQSMARLQANQILQHVAGAHLALSLDECRQLMRFLDVGLTETETAKLHQITRGWVAGLILWSLHALMDPGSSKLPAEVMPASVFDYFAGELLEKCDPQIQEFLLQTAFLPHMTAESASRLTRMDAEMILKDLSRQNFFLEKRQQEITSYQYHPLFRDFLLQQASRRYSRKSLLELKSHAAHTMAAGGFTEEAVDLFHQAEEFGPMVDIILSQAPLLTVQGRNNALTGWINGLPPDMIQKNPWLLFWKGMSVMTSQPPQGQALLAQAFEAFTRAGDIVGQIMSWSAVVETFMMMRGTFTTLDRWILEGQRLEPLLPPEMDPKISARFSASFLLALYLRNLNHADIHRLQRRCEALLSRFRDPLLLGSLIPSLFMSYIYLGQMNKAHMLVKQLKPMLEDLKSTPFVRVQFFLSSCIIYLLKGDWPACHRAITKGMAISKDTGIRIYDFVILINGAYCGVLTGNWELAQQYLKQVEQLLIPHALWDISHYHYVAAASALLARDWAQAKFHIDKALDLAKTCGTPYVIGVNTILKGVYHLEQGDLAEATETLDNLADTGIPQHSGYIHFLYNLLRADCALAQDQMEEMAAHLEAAFSNAAQNGLMMAMGLNRQRLSRLCAEALRADIHPRIVTQLVTRMQLTPPSHTLNSDCWPWPVKLHTLGKLEIHSYNKRLALSAKTPQKTLELLKLLVCKQGQDTARDAVIDQLWPDTDGDRAIQNFDTTLHRLRKLLGRKEAVSLEAGRLTLNQTLCWVDAWYFESLVDQAKSISNPTKQIELLTESIALYSGTFDGLHDENTWGVGYAERLKARWIEAVVTLGKLLNERGQSEQAEDLFQNALALDETVEPFYQALMTALSAQGRTAEALLTFNRCRTVLANQGMEPSAAIMALHQELQEHRTASKQKRG